MATTSSRASQLDWNLLRTFSAVASRGSLAAGARELGLAHPTVARHIQSLEAHLGLRLFERTASGLSLNESGVELLAIAHRMQHEAREFESRSEAVRDSSKGTVRITISELLVDLVPELLLPLADLGGDAGRRFEVLVCDENLNLLEREADIAIRHARPDQSELVCRRLGSIPFGAFASADYLHRHGPPTRDDAARHWYIDSYGSERMSTAAAKLGYVIDESRYVFRSDSLQARRNAAVAGWGIAGLPVHVGEAEPGLQRVMQEAGRQISVEVWLAARPAVRQRALLREVARHVGDALSRCFSTDDTGTTAALASPA